MMIILTGDYTALQEVISGRDFHYEVASKVYGVALDEVTEAQRKAGKEINFSFLYGASISTIQEKIINCRGAKVCTDKELKLFFEELFPWVKQLQKQIEASGYIDTLMGYRMPAEEIESYKRVNYLIQRSSSELLKVVLIELADILPDDCYLVSTIHDEVMIDVPKEKCDSVVQIIKTVMETAISRCRLINNDTVKMQVKITIIEGDKSYEVK